MVSTMALLDLFIYLLLNFAATFFSLYEKLACLLVLWVCLCVCVRSVWPSSVRIMCVSVCMGLSFPSFLCWLTSLCRGRAVRVSTSAFQLLGLHSVWPSLLVFSSLILIFYFWRQHSLAHPFAHIVHIALAAAHWLCSASKPRQRVDKEKTQRKCCCKRSACGIYSGSVELWQNRLRFRFICLQWVAFHLVETMVTECLKSSDKRLLEQGSLKLMTDQGELREGQKKSGTSHRWW